jgi:carboxymethylenebutenolidase
MGEMISFRANGRTAEGYLSLPESGTGPGLLMIQEWWGLVGHIRDVADRFAAAGFVALAPDLYRGETTRSPDQAGKLMMALNIAEAATDLRGAAEHLRAMNEVSPKGIGALGFCMGGQLALFAGCEHSDIITATVNFYGVHPNVQPDVSKLSGPVLAHFAEQDPMTTPELARALIERIEAAGKVIEAHFYDADHAFFNDQRPEVFSPADAELAWERTVAFLRRELAASGS